MARRHGTDGDSDTRPTASAPRVRPIPEGYHTVSPWIASRDTDRLLAFMKHAFGAEELARVPNPDGSIGHAEARVGDAVVLMFDAGADWPETPAFLRLYVADADATFQRALEAGATPVTEVTALFFGDRVGRVRDPLGNLWWIQAHVEDVTPEELERRAQDPDETAAMRRVQDSLHAYMKRQPPRS
jgi:PhnB protein